MTREEFIAEAKSRGKSKEETRSKFDQLDSQGAFDNSPAKISQPQQPAPKQPQEIGSATRAALPLASSLKESGHRILSQAAVPLDMISAPFRALDAAVNKGSQIINPLFGIKSDWQGAQQSLADMVPGNGIVSQNARAGITMATSPSTYASMLPISALVKTPAKLAEQQMLSQLSTPLTKPITAKGMIGKLKDESGMVALAPSKKAIPDIDEMASKAELINTKPGVMSVKEVNQQVQTAPKKGVLSRVSDSDANLLKEKLEPQDTPFTDYALQAKKAVQNKREMTPMDMAGQKAVNVLNDINNRLNDYGNKMQEAIKPVQDAHYSSGILIDTSPVKSAWEQATQKYLHGSFDESGNIKAVEGKQITDPKEVGLYKDINQVVNKLGSGSTIQELLDIKTAIRRMTDNYKASFAQPINTSAEAAGKDFNAALNNITKKFTPPEYQEASENYSRLVKIRNELNRRLGNINDETGTARMGASLMKSAVQSNSDRGTKALFQAVKQITGVDLIKDSGYAEIAMRAAGDARINNLLEDVGKVGSIAHGGALDKALKVGEIAYNKIAGNKLDELINYYNKMQTGKGTLGTTRKLATLGSMGAAGAGGTYLATQRR